MITGYVGPMSRHIMLIGWISSIAVGNRGPVITAIVSIDWNLAIK